MAYGPEYDHYEVVPKFRKDSAQIEWINTPAAERQKICDAVNAINPLLTSLFDVEVVMDWHRQYARFKLTLREDATEGHGILLSSIIGGLKIRTSWGGGR